MGDASAGHALADSTIFEEILLKAADLLVEQVICLMDQAESEVPHDFWWARFHEFAIEFVGLRLLAAKTANEERFS